MYRMGWTQRVKRSLLNVGDSWKQSGCAFLCSLMIVEPQRNVSGLHGLLNHRQQLFMELVQVNLVAQCCVEGCQGAGSVVLAPVEAAVSL